MDWEEKKLQWRAVADDVLAFSAVATATTATFADAFAAVDDGLAAVSAKAPHVVAAAVFSTFGAADVGAFGAAAYNKLLYIYVDI